MSPSGPGTSDELLSALSGDERTTLDSLGETARVQAVKTLADQLQTTMEIEEVALAATSTEELGSLVGESYIAAEVELATTDGRTMPSVLYIGQDDVNLLFNLTAVEGDEVGGAESNLETRVGEIVDGFLGAINQELVGLGRNVALSLSSVYLVDETQNPVPRSVLAAGGRLARLSYNLVLPNIMATEISHVAPLDFLFLLASDRAIESPGGGRASARRPAPVEPARPVGRPLDPEPAPRPTTSFGSGLGGGRPSAAPLDDLLGGGLTGFDEPESPAPARGQAPAVRAAQFAPLALGGDAPASSNIDLLLDVALRVTVELGRTQMNIRDILALGPGSIVELEKLAGEPVDILVNDRLIAKGEVVVVDENFGVRVTDIVTPAKRVASLH